ncbi:MAG: 8-amino-7-oxononanoate synthase [Gammaproteobacteria bacterium]|nr:MAG: 8-amino-7-oxononanoate synthase [Gammaproteobacteria bacterium]
MKDLATKLDKLKHENLFRTRKLISSAQQVEPIINGQKILSFCSNDYLGLANHPKVIERLTSATQESGVGSGASHLITGHHQSHAALEEELAEFLGCEQALLFSTGYMANLGVVSALATRNSTIFADKLNHASLNDAVLLSRAKLSRYAHQETNQLEKNIAAEEKSSKFILTDGVFSMDGTITPFKILQTIAKKHSAALIVDDAHGIGVLGKQGKGCTEGLLSNDDILIGTLGKAFGTFGAFVAARKETIEWVIQKAHSYIYTTALPPAIAEATRASLQLIKQEAWRREHLQELIQYFQDRCQHVGINVSASSTPIQPIILGSSETALEVSKNLLKTGILAPAIRPPTVPNNTARLRISFSATHTKQQIDQLIVALEQLVT